MLGGNEMLNSLREKYEIRQYDKYTLPILCGKIRLWDIPVRIRRGELCRCLYISAFRYARDSGKGRECFLEDYAFLCKELKSCTSYTQFRNLTKAYSTVVDHGEFMNYF